MRAAVNIEELEKKIDFESVSSRLMQLSENGGLNRRKTITDLLDKVKPALEQAREKKVSFAALTQFLKESGIPVSEPTLRQYLRGVGNLQTTSKLSESITAFKPRFRSKQNALELLAEEIKVLKAKGATNAEIAELVTQSGLEVGKDTLRRFVAQLGITKTPQKPKTKVAKVTLIKKCPKKKGRTKKQLA